MLGSMEKQYNYSFKRMSYFWVCTETMGNSENYFFPSSANEFISYTSMSHISNVDKLQLDYAFQF